MRGFRAELLLLHGASQLKWFRHLIRTPPGCFPLEFSGPAQWGADSRGSPELSGCLEYFVYCATSKESRSGLKWMVSWTDGWVLLPGSLVDLLDPLGLVSLSDPVHRKEVKRSTSVWTLTLSVTNLY